MNRTQLEGKLRNHFIEVLTDFVKEGLEEDDVLRVGANEIAFPTLDAENNETWIVFKVSVPRGTRNGEGGYDPYDAYTIAEDYALDCQEKAQKKAETEAKKQAKIARDEKKRAEKKALAEANKNLNELRKIKLTEKKGEQAE